MKKRNASRLSMVLIAALGALALVGCDLGVGATPGTATGTLGALSSDAAVASNGSLTVDLLAGQNILAGSVTFTVDTNEETLTVTYTTQDDWELTEVHLWVGLDLDDMPTNRAGNPQIGRFPFANDELDGVTSYSFVLSAADFADVDFAELCDETVHAAAHAVLQRPNGDDGYQTETGWADGSPIREGGSWATYVSFVVDCSVDEENDFFPVWGQDISNVILVFLQSDGSYYTVKIDEWPDEADNDLDNSIDEILAFLLAEDDNVTEESVLLGAIIKGGTQTTEYYTYGPGSTGPDLADELPEGTGLTLDGTSANASPSNAIDTTFDYDEIFE